MDKPVKRPPLGQFPMVYFIHIQIVPEGRFRLCSPDALAVWTRRNRFLLRKLLAEWRGAYTLDVVPNRPPHFW